MMKTLVVLDFVDGTVMIREISEADSEDMGAYFAEENIDMADKEYMVVDKLVIKN